MNKRLPQSKFDNKKYMDGYNRSFKKKTTCKYCEEFLRKVDMPGAFTSCSDCGQQRTKNKLKKDC